MSHHDGSDLVTTMIVAVIAFASLTLLVLVLAAGPRQSDVGRTGGNTCQRYGDC